MDALPSGVYLLYPGCFPPAYGIISTDDDGKVASPMVSKRSEESMDSKTSWRSLMASTVRNVAFLQASPAVTGCTRRAMEIANIATRWMTRALRPKPKPTSPLLQKTLAAFDLDYPLMRWSPTDHFCLRDAVTGVLVFGGTGGGKTSGPLRSLLKAYFRAGYGGIIFTTKPGEYAEIREWAEETGRLDSLIRFAPEEKHRFSFMTYASRLAGRGSGLTENIVTLLTTIQESFDKDGDSGGKQEKYWALALRQLHRNAIDLRLLSRPNETLSVRSLYDVIVSAPVNLEQVDSEAWQKSSECYRLLDEAVNNESLSPRQKSDLEITGRYFLREFPALPGDTRGSVISTFTTMADIFLRGQIGELFSTGLTVLPELAFEGAIIVIDIPIKTFGQVGIASQTLWKYMFQQACERRDVSKNSRPVFLASDECHNIVNQHDLAFLTTARSSRCCSIYMTQTFSNLVAAMGGDQKGKPSRTDLPVCWLTGSSAPTPIRKPTPGRRTCSPRVFSSGLTRA